MLTMDTVIKAITPNKATLLSGHRGAHRFISNIHTIEDKESARFIREHELIFITGVAISSTKKLEELIELIAKRDIAGIVLNTGFYIHSVPQYIVNFCDKKDVPLLNLPWKYVLSDIQKAIYKELVSKQYKDTYIAYLLEQIVHRTHPRDLQHLNLLQLKTGESFCICILDLSENISNKENILSVLRTLPTAFFVFEEEILHGRIVLLFRQENFFGVQTQEKNIRNCLNKLGVETYKGGIGMPCASWKNLAESYDEAELSIITASELSYPQPFLISFNNILLLKILKNTDNTEMLEQFVNKMLGGLEEYDKKHGSDFLRFLQVWFKHSGKATAIADELFIHRNTVAYRINKIKSILGYDELTYPVISNLFLALLIKQILISRS